MRRDTLLVFSLCSCLAFLSLAACKNLTSGKHGHNIGENGSSSKISKYADTFDIRPTNANARVSRNTAMSTKQGNCERDYNTKRPESLVSGGLTYNQVNKAIMDNYKGIHHCRLTFLIGKKNKRVWGWSELVFTIGKDGRVGAAKIGRSTLKDSETEGCYLKVLKEFLFPKSTKDLTRVRYAFELRSRSNPCE